MMPAISYWVIKKLVDKFPNDRELGEKVRELINSK